MIEMSIAVWSLWVIYFLLLLSKPEIFGPLLPVMALLTIFFSLLGIVVESGRSAQAKIMADLEHKQTMERKAFDHQAEMARYQADVRRATDNASYFIDGLGRTQKK